MNWLGPNSFRTRSSDPPRGRSASAQKAATPTNGTARSAPRSGISPPQRSGRQHVLLIRHTGMRIGECADLWCDCLRPTGPNEWAVHVSLGKLQTERIRVSLVSGRARNRPSAGSGSRERENRRRWASVQTNESYRYQAALGFDCVCWTGLQACRSEAMQLSATRFASWWRGTQPSFRL